MFQVFAINNWPTPHIRALSVRLPLHNNPMKRARVEVVLPSHDEIKKIWFNTEGGYTGPGKKGLAHCNDCHQWKFEHRYQQMVLHIPNPPQSHTCSSKCSGFESCPTQWKEGHPEVLEQERKEKEAQQLNTPRIRDGEQCPIVSQHPDVRTA